MRFHKKICAVLLHDLAFIALWPVPQKLLHIENAMRQPMELAGPPAYTLHKAMVVIVAFNGALGLCGYLRYGERCLGSISLSLPSNNRLVYNNVMVLLAASRIEMSPVFLTRCRH